MLTVRCARLTGPVLTNKNAVAGFAQTAGSSCVAVSPDSSFVYTGNPAQTLIFMAKRDLAASTGYSAAATAVSEAVRLVGRE